MFATKANGDLYYRHTNTGATSWDPFKKVGTSKPGSTDEAGWGERAVTRGCPCVLGDWDLRRFQYTSTRKGTSGMRLSHTLRATSAAFDDPNLVSSAGLVPVLALADRAGLREPGR